MYCSNDYGPAFGSNSNLYCYSNNNGAWHWSIHNNNTICYPNIDSAHSNVKADDYEVFKLLKK